MIRDLVCKRCNNKIGEEETIRSTKPRSVKLCPICKINSLAKHREVLHERNKCLIFRKRNSERLKYSNPMKNPECRAKVAKTVTGKDVNIEDYLINKSDREKLTSEEVNLLNSARMKTNNPMKNSDSKAKMMATFKARVESGEIKYKKGKNHHLWKGNRLFSDIVRCQLFSVWTYKILERDNFTCQDCKGDRHLTVHHLHPLREMIAIVGKKNEIKNFNDIPSVEWQRFIDEIISLHNLEDGITLCQSCHAKKDILYHANSKYRKNRVRRISP